MFDIEDYNYELPSKLIAQVPAADRDHSRLLVVDRSKRSFFERYFFHLPNLLRPGDLLVVNNTRVVPARLFGRKMSGGRVELLVLEHPDPGSQDTTTRWCLFKSSKGPKKGQRILFGGGVSAQVKDIRGDGLVKLAFKGDQSIDSLLEEKGHIPLPPYIKRHNNDAHGKLDQERYQTIFSEISGAVACPTAGLHFSKGLITGLKNAGITVSPLTLHVGYGTFRPVRTRDIRNHRLDEEFYRIDPATFEVIKQGREEGRRVIAVGTTVVRALETAFGSNGTLSLEGRTNLLITPGYPFRVVDGLITNFHLPKSSLLFLVSAFAGLELIREAYTLAVTKEYRFYSYGDAMLIL